jgi:hypothetical protein
MIPDSSNFRFGESKISELIILRLWLTQLDYASEFCFVHCSLDLPVNDTAFTYFFHGLVRGRGFRALRGIAKCHDMRVALPATGKLLPCVCVRVLSLTNFRHVASTRG